MTKQTSSVILRKPEFMAGICVLCFLAAQTFQELAYRFWMPESRNQADDLNAYLLPVDQIRALLVGGSILLLIVPFVVIALRYRRVAPLLSTLGLVFSSAFVGLETVHRSIDFFVVGKQWAHQFQSATGVERDLILQRFSMWNQVVQGWYFPLLLSYLLASLCFALATATDRSRGVWYWLAPVAFSLNALRLLGRMLSSFGGQRWLDGLNGKLYFPAVLLTNALLVAWFFHLARLHTAEDPSHSATALAKS
jgi:hypothetical protein